MKSKHKEYLWAFCIVGENCGRDASGTFHCVCGKCHPLRVDVGKGGKYCGDDCRNNRYESQENVDMSQPIFRLMF